MKVLLHCIEELRSHGVGYYQFSKDEQERAAEMERLSQIREETKSVRAAKERLKDKRKALLTNRLEKVKQRRIAQGKPVPESRNGLIIPHHSRNK